MFWRIIFVFLISLNIFLIYKLFIGEKSLPQYIDLKHYQEELEEQLQQVKKDNLELSRQIRLLRGNPEYLEKVIRSEMHFVNPDEVIYLFPGKK